MKSRIMAKPTFFLLLVFLLSACGSPAAVETSPSSSPAAEALKSADTATEKEALVSQGFNLIEDSDWYYFSCDGLLRVTRDFSAATLLLDETPHYLCMHEGALYYVLSDGENAGIWRMKPDGADKEKLLPGGGIAYLYAADNTLYYLKGPDICFLHLPGYAPKAPATDAEEDGPAAAEGGADAFYFSDTGTLGEQYASDMMVFKDKIYYLIINADGTAYELKSMNTDGTDIKKIAENMAYNPFPYKDRLYYYETSDEDIGYSALCSIALDGSDKKVHLKDACNFLCVRGDNAYISYPATDAEGMDIFPIFRLDFETGERTLLYEADTTGRWFGYAGTAVAFEKTFIRDAKGYSEYYLGSIDGKTQISAEKLHGMATRSEYLGEYVKKYGPGESTLYLKTNELSACYKLYRVDAVAPGREEFIEFLEPGSEKTMTFPCGRYILKVAEGETWLGDEKAFGPDGRYSVTETFEFKQGMRYEIGSGSRGDFKSDSMDGFLN